MRVIQQKGYTVKESARITRFVADFKADGRTWQERIVANASPDEREALKAAIAR